MFASRMARRSLKSATLPVSPNVQRKSAAGAALDLSRVPAFPPAALQRKLAVGAADDALEREADEAADRVMRSPAPIAGGASAGRRLSRRCAACEGDEAIGLQRKPGRAGPEIGEAPAIVEEVLRASGDPLDPSARDFFEPRFQSDFAGVRVHSDPRAARSASAVGAIAYTVGGDIAFADGRYRPGDGEGRRLLAHELAHVVQQGGAPPLSEHAAAGGAAGQAVGGRSPPSLMRANPDAVGEVMEMDQVVGAGIQFYPALVTETRIGPVSVQGGTAGQGSSRLYVIVGTNLSPRVLARQILPLWTTAEPFVPAGGGAPVAPGPLSEDQLAQALIAFNDAFLGVPAMTQWRAGLHFPLPVEIDESTGVVTVSTDLILRLAGGFDPAWTPLLERPAAATAAPAPVDLQAEAASFLASQTSVTARGMALGVRAMANAQEALPFVDAVFMQLGAGAFEVALEMMDSLVNRDADLLAAQRDGLALLVVVGAALAAAPAAPSATQQASLDHANALLNRAVLGAAANPSAPVATRAEKSVTIDTVKLDGSGGNPAAQVAIANTIYAQCNVRFVHGADVTATPQQTDAWIGTDRVLASTGLCSSLSREERTMFRSATADFGLSSRFRAFFVPRSNQGVGGYSRPPYCATGGAAPFRNMLVVEDAGNLDTIAHEAGHVLINSGAHPRRTLMTARQPTPNELLNPQCAAIYRNA